MSSSRLASTTERRRPRRPMRNRRRWARARRRAMRQYAREGLDQRLRAGTRDHVFRRCAVAHRRGCLEPRKRAGLGQPRPCLEPQIWRRIGVRIDARGEINPGLGRSRRELTGDFKRAAVIGKRSVIRGPKQSRRHVAPAFAAARARRRCLGSAIGYPAPLYLAIGHPVTWMGRWLAWLEAILNRAEASFAARRAAGVLALCLYLAPVALVAWAATRLCLSGGRARLRRARPSRREPAGATQPRHTCASGRRRARRESRRRTSRGREDRRPQSGRAGRGRRRARRDREPGGEFLRRRRRADLLDRARRPAGGALYKAINTADSMIGHKNERYSAFGWAAARLDDLVNLPASRLAALWFILAAALTPGASARDAARAVRRDAGAPPLAQRRLARSGDGRRARPQACRPARLWRDAGRRRLHGERPARGRRRRHPAGAAAL